MEEKELRIGNLVDSEYNGVTDVGVRLLEDIANGAEIVEPIPLTEEWLLKLGEMWYGDYQLFFYIKDNHLYYDKNFSLCDRISCCEIKYIHQLQNLYFALTNKELTLKE